VGPEQLPDTIFASVGRSLWRDIGPTAVIFRWAGVGRAGGQAGGCCRRAVARAWWRASLHSLSRSQGPPLPHANPEPGPRPPDAG
jgi:hypothetical protein